MLELLGELQELCKRRHSLDVPGQCPPLAQGSGFHSIPEFSESQ